MSTPVFTGFSIAKKPAPKPTVQSSLLTSSSLSAPKPSIHNEDKHEALRKTTEAAQIGLRKEDEEAMKKALEEDPTVFDYDDFEEEFQPRLQSRKKPLTGNAKYGYGITVSDASKSKGSSASAPQPKYIENLLQKAREREVERDLVFERQKHKENMKYEEMYGSTESFITPEYQAKLDEMERSRAELERKDRKDASSSNMANFYSNLNRAIAGGPSSADSVEPSSSGTDYDTPSASSHSANASSTKDTAADSPCAPVSEHRKETPPSPTAEPTSTSSSNTQERQSLIAKTARKPRRHTDEMVDAAKLRYQQRKLRREQSKTPNT